jgi:hypothetical protein
VTFILSTFDDGSFPVTIDVSSDLLLLHLVLQLAFQGFLFWPSNRSLNEELKSTVAEKLAHSGHFVYSCCQLIASDN